MQVTQVAGSERAVIAITGILPITAYYVLSTGIERSVNQLKRLGELGINISADQLQPSTTAPIFQLTRPVSEYSHAKNAAFLAS